MVKKKRSRSSASRRGAPNPEGRPVGSAAGDLTVVDLVKRRPGLTTQQLSGRLQVTDDAALQRQLLELQRRGEVLCVPGNGWSAPETTSFRVGRLQLPARGGAKVFPGKPDAEPVWLEADGVGGGLDRDIVLVKLTSKPRHGRGLRGRVIEVLDRQRKVVRGRYWKSKTGGRVVSEGSQRVELYIPVGSDMDARDGEHVVARLEAGFAEPRGRILARLREMGVLAADLAVIRAEFDLPSEPSPEVERVAMRLPELSTESFRGRRDLRRLETFTIDPEKAEDFDDAISLEELDGGRSRLGIHIADVSHYVKSGSLLDRHAAERATSVYLPGTVIPMLPERLSNDLCSLRPEVDRLTKTARLTFDSDGRIVRREVFRSVIRSRRRFSYREVQDILSRETMVREGAALRFDHCLKRMMKLARALKAERLRRGALDLDLDQLQVDVDLEEGVTGIGKYERTDAHSLIEEFMLAANETVARYCLQKKSPISPASTRPQATKTWLSWLLSWSRSGFDCVVEAIPVACSSLSTRWPSRRSQRFASWRC